MSALTRSAADADAGSGGSWQALCAIFQRDLRIALRRRADTGAALVFFVIVVSLFPLGVGPQFELLRQMGPGVVWVAALLASMLSMGRLFADDHADGTLEQMLLSPTPLALLVLAKTAAHWLASGLLLVLISPLLALQFDLGAEAAVVLFVSLLLGTPLLSLVGAIGAALTVGLRGAGVLLSLLVLPLCAPVLIFGAGAVEASQAGLGVAAHYSLLGAMLVLALFLAPLAGAAALRIAVE
jgi:heme exporter protein B